MSCQLRGSSSERSCKSILSCIARAEIFLSSVFKVAAFGGVLASSSLMDRPPRSRPRDGGVGLDGLRGGVDRLFSFAGQRLETVEPEPMNVTEALGVGQEPAGGEDEAPEPFVAHLHHRRGHQSRAL